MDVLGSTSCWRVYCWCGLSGDCERAINPGQGSNRGERKIKRAKGRQFFPLLAAFGVSNPGGAPAQTAPRVQRDIAYVEPKNERQLLDVYAPATGSNLPVVVWVHGGGWMGGSKNEVDHKPAAFAEK